jgi:hypothetical protein
VLSRYFSVLGVGQGASLARGQHRIQNKVADPFAVQVDDPVAGSGKHALYLVISAFRDRHPDLFVRNALELRGGTNTCLTLEMDSAPNLIQGVIGDRFRQPNPIGLG